MASRRMWLTRWLQWGCSIAGLATVSLAARPASWNTHPVTLGSGAITLATLVAYSSLLYATLWLALGCWVTGSLGAITLQSFMWWQVLDMVFAMLFFIAGVTMSASDYVTHCRSYGMLLRCRCLWATDILCFVLVLLFLASLLLSAYEARVDIDPIINIPPPTELDRLRMSTAFEATSPSRALPEVRV